MVRTIVFAALLALSSLALPRKLLDGWRGCNPVDPMGHSTLAPSVPPLLATEPICCCPRGPGSAAR